MKIVLKYAMTFYMQHLPENQIRNKISVKSTGMVMWVI